jgi:flagellar basal-body rod protein FlgF
MAGLVETASAILSGSERRLETVSINISNASTAGYKRQISFSDMLTPNTVGAAQQSSQRSADLAQGRMSSTGNKLDLAIGGAGFFQLRAGDSLVYSRQGQFRLAADGTVVTPQGHALQQAGGGDLVLDNPAVEILEDGTILDGERPVGRIALFAAAQGAAPTPLAGSLFAIDADVLEDVARPQLRQGMVEASNVSMGEEMVSMMTAVRQAEVGSRLVQVYDDLIGKAIAQFGQGAR